MTYRIFQYRLPMEGQPDDLNACLASDQVVAVTQHLARSSGGDLLVFVVETTGGNGGRRRETRVDYKEKLSPEDFAVYGRLRELRKDLAEKEGVPVFAVVNNAQLAWMVEHRVTEIDDLLAIPGIGRARAEKYGAAFLAALGELKSDEGEEP